MKKAWLFFISGILVLCLAEILKVYFIMPFPGSQLQNNVELAYNFNKFIWVFRLLSGCLIIFGLIRLLAIGKLWHKLLAGVLILPAIGIFYVTNFVMLADKIFYQPHSVVMSSVAQSTTDKHQLVLGIVENGEAKAYPIQIIGYHHQVRDSIDHLPIMVTYCTVCRTGRVFRPVLNGKIETFRLVGMDQFNAMFEDASTHSWWRQATGECCAGPLKGQRLPELPTQQMTLAAWATSYPQSTILQPDPAYASHYKALKDYGNGEILSGLTGTDTASTHPKSWIVAVRAEGGEKMYPWSELKAKGLINDTMGRSAILMVIEPDQLSFHTYDRQIDDTVFTFALDSLGKNLVDAATSSIWNLKGACTEGPLKGAQLKTVDSYQEFLHSYLTFGKLAHN